MLFMYYLLTSTIVTSINQLAFSGGGSFGAIEIGILKKIQSKSDTVYDVYTGISAGGINAAYLSHFNNLSEGIETAEYFYSTTTNDMVYSLLPRSGVSIYNTIPLYNTLSSVISTLQIPNIPTYIGATNLYSGYLDIYRYDLFDTDAVRIDLLMCTSAIPIIFPPIYFNGSQYADGGILENQLLNVINDNTYINITYITPSQGLDSDNTPIDSIKDMLLRTTKVVVNNFNNAHVKLNQNCDIPIGEINKYYVNSSLLTDYNILDFNYGGDLIKIGYNNVQHEKFKLC